MSETTVDPDMPPTPKAQRLVVDHSNSFKIRLFVEDQKLIHEIQADASPIIRELTLAEIVRDAVHAGLPIVRKRYLAAVEAAMKIVENEK